MDESMRLLLYSLFRCLADPRGCDSPVSACEHTPHVVINAINTFLYYFIFFIGVFMLS